jgi:hypothetical protein
MLIIDGVKYKLWTPKDEEKEFHPMIKKYSKEIFGEDSLYFDVKHILKTISGIGTIPDAYVICLSRKQWYVVENELASHPIYDHIVKQLTKFINGIENQNTKTQITDMLYDEINNDIILKATVQKKLGSTDPYHFLSKLISKPPTIVIIIDQKTPEIIDACRALKYQPHIIQFRTFTREDAPTIRAHEFDSITIEKPKPSEEEKLQKGEITPQHEYTLPLLESLIEMGGSGKSKDVLNGILSKMEHKLKDKDFEKMPSGSGIRWIKIVQWEKLHLIKKGYLKKGSPRGIWEITEAGKRFYKSLKEKK